VCSLGAVILAAACSYTSHIPALITVFTWMQDQIFLKAGAKFVRMSQIRIWSAWPDRSEPDQAQPNQDQLHQTVLWNTRSFDVLCSLEWKFLTDISGQG
jgi:hypothetical protein